MSAEAEFKARLPMEVAAAIAQGYSQAQIRSELDISALELEEVVEKDEFKEHLATYGEHVVASWEDHRATSRAQSVDRKIEDDLDDFYEILRGHILEKKLKPETAASVIIKLIDRVAPKQEDVKQVRMPPSTIDNLVRRQHEYEEHIEDSEEEVSGDNPVRRFLQEASQAEE